MEKISENSQMKGAAGKPSPQNGNGLMVGLLRCRRCGSKLRANYRASGVNYVCRGGSKQRDMLGKTCFSFRAAYIEQQLCELIMEVVEPAGVAAASNAAERLAAIHEQDRRIIVDRLEAAREIERRAAREYKKTDATYTTVRQRLAQEWEEALVGVQAVEEQLALFDRRQQCVPTPAQQQQLADLGKSLRRIWHHPNASMVLKKQIVRTLIEEIVVDQDKTTNEVVLMIHWSGGLHTELRTPTNWRRRRNTIRDLRAIVGTLRKVLNDKAIASVLNREKLFHENETTWNGSLVAEYRKKNRIPAFDAGAKEKAGWLTQAEAATSLGISPMSVSRLVRSGILPAEQRGTGLPTLIKRSDLTVTRVEQAVHQLKDSKSRPLPLDPNQQILFETNDSHDS